jgi:hypothetical protein
MQIGGFMELFDVVEGIATKENLADFVAELRLSLRSKSSDWENPSLERFLEAMEAWVRTMDSYATNTGDTDAVSPNWRTFAKILYAAKVYE